LNIEAQKLLSIMYIRIGQIFLTTNSKVYSSSEEHQLMTSIL